MSHKNIPLPERQRLREDVQKHNLANILTHWFNVASWLVLLPAGITIISSPRLEVSPHMVARGIP
jgi:cytochrome b subunit of formate dehydrogenase